MQYKIREMETEDFEIILEIWKNTEGIGLGSSDTKKDIGKFLMKNPGSCFVAECGGEIAGTVLCGNDGRRGFIYHLAVINKFRKMGIGKNLVDKALSSLKIQGIRRCQIVVKSGNTSGMAFWLKSGWNKRDDLIPFSIDL